MSNPRILGLTLMAISITAFLGSTSGSLPAATFFPALGLFVIGAFKFLRSNHEAMARAEQRAHRAVNPMIRENRQTEELATNQVRRQEAGLAAPTATDHPAEPTAGPSRRSEDMEIETGDLEVVVTSDVSFPVEIQRGDALADQLQKLNQLLEQSVLTEEEYAVAKAKLLS